MLSSNSNEQKKILQIADTTLRKVTDRAEILMHRGEGLYLFDTKGNQYLDFIGGWAVNCLGHCPKAIFDVLVEQSRRLINASPSFFNLPMLEYADL